MESFDLSCFNEGQFLDAVRHKSEAEAISQVLYPNDDQFRGKAFTREPLSLLAKQHLVIILPKRLSG
jgi:glucan phosphorylase